MALRVALSDFLARASDGRLQVHVPPRAPGVVTGGQGHFHLVPELFLQMRGHTRFHLPQAQLDLPAGQALIVPAKTLHDERVSAEGPGEDAAFANVVIQADTGTLNCHLAHEIGGRRPGILHLEDRRHPQALRIQDWLGDAVWAAQSGTPWAQTQACALVCTALAGVLGLLDNPAPEVHTEPALVARARVLAQNQLGDHRLSVAGLAAQCQCTADYLSHVFSTVTGEHLTAWILRLRLHRAARLLSESRLASKEIAWACGFASQSYFSRCFRQQHAMSPREFRAHAAALGPRADDPA